MNGRKLIEWFLHPIVIVGAVVVALLLLVIAFSVLWLSRPGPTTSGAQTAIFNVLRAPTATPQPITPTPQLTPSADTDQPPSPPPGVITVNALVQISGTGGDGLRFRESPGLNGQVRLLGAEAEVFQVRDGPQEIDGYTWWFLVGLYDETRQGWAVSNFLSVIQNP